MNKKLLYVVPDFLPSTSGYAHACENFAFALADLGYDIEILSFKYATLPSHHPNISVKCIIRSTEDEMKSKFTNELSSDYDGMILETFENSDISNWLIDTLKIPHGSIAVRIHAATETEIFVSATNSYHKIMFEEAKLLAKRIPNIWSTSNYYINFFKNHYGLSPIETYLKKFAVIPNIPNNFSGTALLQPSNYLSSKITGLENCKIILALGRMSEQGISQKNFQTLLEAVLLSRNEFASQSCKIIMIGDGELRANLEFQAQLDDIQDHIVFIPKLEHEDTLYLINRAHAAVLISKYEGHSMFSLECMSNGLPLLFSNDTALSEFIEDTKTGIAIDPMDIFSVAKGLISIVNSNFEKNLIKDHYFNKFGYTTVLRKIQFFTKQLTSKSKYPRAIIFGTGGFFEKLKDKIYRNFTIIAFADNNIGKQGTYLNNYPVISPDTINQIDYDKIVIASTFKIDIKNQLLDLGIDLSDIIELCE